MKLTTGGKIPKWGRTMLTGIGAADDGRGASGRPSDAERVRVTLCHLTAIQEYFKLQKSWLNYVKKRNLM